MKRKSIEERVQAMWDRGDGTTDDGEAFIRRLLPRHLRAAYARANDQLAKAYHTSPKLDDLLRRLDRRYARLADALDKREKKGAHLADKRKGKK
jgi:hypothetical protein